jgi:hypothetical protein
MPKRLPKEVVQFLLDDPKELERVQFRMKDVEEQRTRPARIAAEIERRKALPLKPCPGNGYGCGRLTPGGYNCDACVQEYRDDPDAYK